MRIRVGDVSEGTILVNVSVVVETRRLKIAGTYVVREDHDCVFHTPCNIKQDYVGIAGCMDVASLKS